MRLRRRQNNEWTCGWAPLSQHLGNSVLQTPRPHMCWIKLGLEWPRALCSHLCDPGAPVGLRHLSMTLGTWARSVPELLHGHEHWDNPIACATTHHRRDTLQPESSPLPIKQQDRHSVSGREILVSFALVVLVKFHVKQQSSYFFNLSKTSKSNDLTVLTKPILPGSVLSHLTHTLEFQALPFARMSP